MDDRDETWLRPLMTKNAVDWSCSVGAFDGDELVGISLTGLLDTLAFRMGPDPRPVKLVEVERGAGGLGPFLESRGFELEISRFEMTMAL